MINKCFFYCSYKGSPCGYEPTKITLNDSTKKWTQFRTDERDRVFLQKVYSINDNITLFEVPYNSVRYSVLLLRNVQQFLPIDNKDKLGEKYISVMFCSNQSDNSCSKIALAALCKPREVMELLFDAVITENNDSVDCSYTINPGPIDQLLRKSEKIYKVIQNNNKTGILDMIKNAFFMKNEFGYVIKTISKDTTISNKYRNKIILKVVEREGNIAPAISLMELFKRKTMFLTLGDINENKESDIVNIH